MIFFTLPTIRPFWESIVLPTCIFLMSLQIHTQATNLYTRWSLRGFLKLQSGIKNKLKIVYNFTILLFSMHAYLEAVVNTVLCYSLFNLTFYQCYWKRPAQFTAQNIFPFVDLHDIPPLFNDSSFTELLDCFLWQRLMLIHI